MVSNQDVINKEIFNFFMKKAAKKSKVHRFFAFAGKMFGFTSRPNVVSPMDSPLCQSQIESDESNDDSDLDQSRTICLLNESDAVNSQEKPKKQKTKLKKDQSPERETVEHIWNKLERDTLSVCHGKIPIFPFLTI